MNLLDHFHPPLSVERHWESFHSQWASSIASALNRDLLPQSYFAETQVHVGSRVEVDVASFEAAPTQARGRSANGGGTATLPAAVWAPPAAEWIIPAIFPDSIEVLVYNSEAGPTIVAAIELVSPGNKDRDDYRRAFAAKCASLLQGGIGLVIVDIVTDRRANLHNELIDLMESGDRFRLAPDPLYATAYKPRRLATAEQIEVWTAELAIDQPLPVMPLPLDKGLMVPLDLAGSYSEACDRSRIR